MGVLSIAYMVRKASFFDYLHRLFVIPVNLSKEAEKDSRRRVIL